MTAQILMVMYAARAGFLVLLLSLVRLLQGISERLADRPRVQDHSPRGFTTAPVLEFEASKAGLR